MKKRSLFSEEELEAMRRADEEIESSFEMTPEDWKRSTALDKQCRRDRMGKIAAQQAAYREANREKYNAYMREYMRKQRLRKACAGA